LNQTQKTPSNKKTIRNQKKEALPLKKPGITGGRRWGKLERGSTQEKKKKKDRALEGKPCKRLIGKKNRHPKRGEKKDEQKRHAHKKRGQKVIPSLKGGGRIAKPIPLNFSQNLVREPRGTHWCPKKKEGVSPANKKKGRSRGGLRL